MPRSDIQDTTTFQRFQGIDTRDDGEANTASDIMNVRIDETGRLTNANLPSKISTDADTELAIWAFHALADDGSEIDCNIDEYTATPVATVVRNSNTVFIITLSAGSALMIQRIIAIFGSTPVKVLTDEIDFTAVISGSVITCTHSSDASSLLKVLIWFPTVLLELSP
jgi:hypothetical protein